MTERIPDGGGTALLELARASIARRLNLNAAWPAENNHDIVTWLTRPGATFVTLTKRGQLRGCIGSLEARRPLGDDVRDNACNAAFRDPRFPRLTADELPETHVEVSLLSQPEPVAFGSEAEAVEGLQPGVDGLILVSGGHRGTFLPQVWDQLPDPQEFLAHLKRKAGLPMNYWDDGVRLYRYTVTAWEEENDDG